MLETALHQHLAHAGAVHADDHGVALPRHFGDAAGEYAALAGGAAVVDLGFRTLVDATGPDRTSFLQGMLTNDVARLATGEGCRALLLTIQGRVTADVHVATLDAALRLDVDVRVRDAFVAALQALLIADDVELGPPAGDALALIGVDGPEAGRLVSAAAALPGFAHVATDVGGVPVRAQRASLVGGAGLVLHVAAGDAPRVWDALVAHGARACGMDAFEARRIERVVPRVDVDMGATTLALEVPVEEAISQTKGCYLGQEVIARGTARGHVNRRLCQLVGIAGMPAAGAALVADGKEVGHLTSVAWSWSLGAPVALGFVRRERWDVGTELDVGGQGDARVRVATAPVG